jgi:putative glutamine amidotransferase
VAAGGTMVQDIWAEVYKVESVENVLLLDPQKWHKNPYAELYPEKEFVFYHLHKIRLCPQGKFISEFGFTQHLTPLVLSSHHQMIDTLGKDLQIIATSWDGRVPEAIEHLKYPHVLGVQFHPEYENLWDPNHSVCFSPLDSMQKSLYSIFIQNPPSLKFHKKLWSWFEENLVEYHSDRLLKREDRN